MGKRTGVFDHEADFLKGSLDELDQEIARCATMRDISTSSRNRKSLESRIHWLGKVRQRHPEINSN